MSFRPGGYPQFEQKLRFEDHIHNQIEACRQALNRGDATEIMYAAESLLTLITPNMEDPDFLADISALDRGWKKTLRKKKAERARELVLSRNGCPDVIDDVPLKPGIDYFRKAIMIALALCERKGLMMKLKTEDDL